MASGGGSAAAEAVTCPICLSLLVQPVTPPCRHTVCLSCFEASMEQASLCCPLCRTRLSVWVRRARKSGSLVDAALWSRLQRQFPDQVRSRLEGSDAELSPAGPISVPVRLSQPGEIRQEFERELEAARHEEQTLRERAEQASHQLIASLQGEEEARAAQEQSDAELARDVRRAQMMLSTPAASGRHDRSRPLARGPSTGTAPARGPMDVYIGQLTPRPGGKQAVLSVPLLPTVTRTTVHSQRQRKLRPVDGGAIYWRRWGPERQQRRTFGAGPAAERPDPVPPAPQATCARCPEDRLGAVGRPKKHRPAALLSQSASDRPAVRGSGLDAAQIRELLSMSESEEEPLPAAGGSDLLPGKRRLEECAAGPAAKVAACAPGGGPAGAEQAAWAWLAESADFATVLAEQQEAERRLEQERADRQMAERLQQELSRQPEVDRRKGTKDAYGLRQPGASKRRPNSQLSIQESMRRGRTRSSC